MFIGHVATALAAKKIAPKTSLGALLLSVSFIDLLWPLMLLLGLEEVRIKPGDTAVTPLEFVSYPITHSLVAATGWGVLVGAVYFLLRRNKNPDARRGALVMGLGVVSHWVLDWVSHRPDMPLWPGGPRYGLGLWNSLPATMAVESAMWFAGLWIYVRVTRPRDRVGQVALGAFILFLSFVYLANLFGPPPPSVTMIGWSALIGGWLLPLWAWWIDRHRDAV